MTKIVKQNQASSLAEIGEAELIKRIRETGTKSDHHYQHSVAWSILQGVYLAQAKETVAHGNFKAWIKANVPDVCYEVANRNRKLAVAIRDQLLSKNDSRVTFEPRELLMLPRLPKARREAILTRIESVADGKSLRQLYHDFDVCRKPDAKGGARVAGPSEPAPEPTPEELRQAAVLQWTNLAAAAERLREEGIHSLLPLDVREAVAAILVETASHVDPNLSPIA